MKERILSYRHRIDDLVAGDVLRSKEEWDDIIDEHLIQIGFFQHERFIHLIVTALFAIILFFSFIVAALLNYLFLIFSGLSLILLSAYVIHYALLENETQKMYEQYDKMLAKRREAKTQESDATVIS